jgi:pyrroloquinoline quinone (PQQ) biosynthesis protein C
MPTLTPTSPLAAFRDRADTLVHEHPVVTANAYTAWFSTGAASVDEVRHLTVQFSVFSHQFLEAQLRRVLNARSLESYHAAKEILLNELGVVFRPAVARTADADGVDPELVATEGTIEGSRFKFAAAHFEWLLRFGRPLGLEFTDLGHRAHGTPATIAFCDALLTLYGSEDPSVGEGASYAVEHWAAAGFWKQLIHGLETVDEREHLELPLAFWTWHDRVEDQHAQHTDDDLAAVFDASGFDEEAFLRGGEAMLDAVGAFWDGLDADRRRGARSAEVRA